MIKVILNLPKYLKIENIKKIIEYKKLHGFKALYKKINNKVNKDLNINTEEKESFKTYYNIKSENNEIIDNKSVDIVIPVYNAYDDLIKCYESILKYTDLKHNTLILVNDKSSDEKIYELLMNISNDAKEQNNKIIVIENKENMGFVKTVNVGMSYSNNDVILLNSDTVVTKDWVEKLKKAAYSRENIASVTPFSNNATICSLPNFLQDNPLPDGFDIDTFAQTVERISLLQYIDVPTAVGFCMYITRKSINKVGLFNYEDFGKGYGEENDFSMRAYKNGFTNIICDNLFVYHKGGQSFSKEVKSKREIESVKTMNRIHPDYMGLVQKFVEDNPLEYYHKAIAEAILLKSQK